MVAKDKKSASKNDLDVDIRFFLANERTLLAWVRTSLAVLAGGLILTQITEDVVLRYMIGLTTFSLSIFMVCIGYVRFKTTDKAIRGGRLPSFSRGPLVQVGAVICVALVLSTTLAFNI